MMKNILQTGLLVLCSAMSACGTDHSASEGPKAAQPQAALAAAASMGHASANPIHAASAPSACPAQTFDTFLTAFADDVEVQKKSVALPLQSESVDALAEPEPKPVTKMLSFAELHFPLMPTVQQRARDGLQISQTPSGKGEIEVKLVKPDTDYQLLFYFRNDGCWKLYRMRDDSL
jgi:hypothetical protein